LRITAALDTEAVAVGGGGSVRPAAGRRRRWQRQRRRYKIGIRWD